MKAKQLVCIFVCLLQCIIYVCNIMLLMSCDCDIAVPHLNVYTLWIVGPQSITYYVHIYGYFIHHCGIVNIAMVLYIN